jgi:uncharacterized membrane protein (UPF0127 family)
VNLPAWALALAAVLVPLTAAAAASPPDKWAVAVFPSGAEFSLEVVADPASRRLGYMFREQIGPRDGMLFIFEEPDRHSIWMKNCKVPLDIIWLDPDFRVVEIARDQPPCPEQGDCPSIVPMRTASYVLELAGGGAAEQDLELGDRIQILSLPSPRP